MRRIYLFLGFLGVMFISGCAPTVFQPDYCENKFKDQKAVDSAIPESFSFSGSAIVSGLPAIVSGSFSKAGDTIKVSSPFGKNLITIERRDRTLCVKMDGFQSCDVNRIISLLSLYMPQIQPLTDINYLKGLISRKFSLTDTDRYECDGKSLKVLRKDYTLVYQDKSLSQIIYKNYTVEYGLNNQIEIKDKNNTLIKINLSSVNFEKN